MKKILSIMLAVMMVVSLFTINSFAAVSHGAASKVVASQDYSDVENNAFMTISSYGDADTNVVDGAMKVTFAEEGASYVQLKATKDDVDFTALPDVFYFDFDVKAVNASLPILIGFALPTKDAEGKDVDGRIGARIFPGCFNPEITKTSAYKTDGTLFDVNKSFSFRVVVDQSKYYADRETLISNGLGDNLYDVIKIYKREEGGFYNVMKRYNTGGNFVYEQGYRTASKGSIVTMGYKDSDAMGIIVNKACDDSTFAANAEYIFDNFKLSWEEEIPAEGVLSYQDYEGTSTTAVSASYGASEPGVSEDGNHFIKMFNDAKKSVNVLLMPADNADFTTKNVTVTFDVCAKKPGAIGVEAYGQGNTAAERTMVYVRTDEGIEVDKWYRVKMSLGGKDITDRVMVKNLTDGGEWEILSYGENGSQYEKRKEFGVGTTSSSGNGRIRIISVYDARRQPEGADPTDVEWWIDNIMITNTEAISFPAVEVADGKINVTVDFEDGYDMHIDTMKPVLAVYDGEGRLVDVDMDTKAVTACEMSAALSVNAASYTDAGEIKLLIWNGGENSEPVLSEAYDISTLLK